MIEVMDTDGQIKCKINVDLKDALITRARAREVILSLIELQSCGILEFSTENVCVEILAVPEIKTKIRG